MRQRLPIGMGPMEEVEEVMQRADKAKRKLWLGIHCAELARILDRPKVAGNVRRLYRARWWQDGELIVASMLQRFDVPDGGVNCIVAVVRSFEYYPAHVPELKLQGRYSKDEICAFLRLDLMDPAEIEWTDETGYIAVPSSVSDLIGRMNG